MKISTIRGLLILGNVVLASGFGGVVYKVWTEKKGQTEDRAAFVQEVREHAQDVYRAASRSGGPPLKPITSAHVDIDLANVPPKQVEVEKKDNEGDKPQPGTGPLTPLAERIELVAIASAVGESRPFFFYTLLEEAADTGAAGPGGNTRPVRPARPAARPGTPRPAGGANPTAGTGVEMHSKTIGEAIEFGSEKEDAVVVRIERDHVVFRYGDEEVSVVLAKFTPEGEPGAVGEGAEGVSSLAGAVATEDTNQWISWNASNPGEIKITPTGVVSIRKQKDAVLEGVTWGSESVSPPGMSTRRAIKLGNVPAGSALARAGLGSGDVILSVNGHAVSNRADIVSYVEQNPNLGRYVVKILSRGAVRTRTVTVPR